MSMTYNKKMELLAQEIYAKGVNKQTHYDTPQGKVAYPKVNYDKMWNVSGYYNDENGNDIRDRDQKIMEQELKNYIENNFTPLGGDLYECDGGHVWHIDMIIDAMREELFY